MAKEREHLVDLGVDERAILKWITGDREFYLVQVTYQ